jgi:hypothetical protein
MAYFECSETFAGPSVMSGFTGKERYPMKFAKAFENKTRNITLTGRNTTHHLEHACALSGLNTNLINDTEHRSFVIHNF